MRDKARTKGNLPISDHASHSEPPTVTEVFAGTALRAVCYWPDRERLIVRFDHWRRDRDGFPMDVPRKKFDASGCACLTIESARNDWFLNRDLPALRKALIGFAAGYEQTNAIGFSMGGYGALLLARELRLSQAILVSPQFSILPEKAPYERRYEKEAVNIIPEFDTLDSGHVDTLQGAILYDPHVRPDRLHAERIGACFPSLTPVPLWFGGHPALGVVAKHGRYGLVLEQLFANQVSPSRILQIHKDARRKSPSYLDGIRGYLSRRA